MEVTRCPENPILKPNPENKWENYAVFNGCPIKVGEKYHLLYRAMGDEVTIDNKTLRRSVIGIAESNDGENFTNRRVLIQPEKDWELFGCEDPRVTFLDGKFYIFYTAVSDWPPKPESVRVALAVSDDLHEIKEKSLITPFNAKAMALFPEKINGRFAALITYHPDTQQAGVGVALFDSIDDIKTQTYWELWLKNVEQNDLHLKRIYHDQVEVGAPPVRFDDSWLLVYSYIKNRWIDKPEFRIEAVLLDLNDPTRMIARVEKPLLEPAAEYEKEGRVKDVVFPSGALVEKKSLYIYYGAADTYCAEAMISLEDLAKNMRRHAFGIPRLARADSPIIKPEARHAWEAKATFNPTVYDDGETVHLLYRAMSFDNTSVLGYAASKNGYHFDERYEEPVYVARTEAEFKKKPFANSGVEDPRLTQIGDTLYLLYTAYDGVNPPRVALSSIKVEDFRNHRWNWKEPVLVSKPDIDDKDAFLLPEKLDDRYVIFHRIGRNIVFDYTDTLELDGNTFFEGSHQIMVRERLWDGARIGGCASPIKTDSGWLLLYHGISSVDREYRVGAMLLYPKHPSIVLARTPYPILEPEMMFERFGHTNNVVFPCGNIVRGDTLFVYYGGGDQVCAVATISLSKLLGYLEELKNPASLGQSV